jgi:DNA polymerase-4
MLAAEAVGGAYRLIGVGLADLAEAELVPADLFGAGGEARARTTETAVDALRGRFGATAIVSGRALRRER